MKLPFGKNKVKQQPVGEIDANIELKAIRTKTNFLIISVALLGVLPFAVMFVVLPISVIQSMVTDKLTLMNMFVVLSLCSAAAVWFAITSKGYMEDMIRMNSIRSQKQHSQQNIKQSETSVKLSEKTIENLVLQRVRQKLFMMQTPDSLSEKETDIYSLALMDAVRLLQKMQEERDAFTNKDVLTQQP